MTISGFQSYSFSAIRLNMTVTSASAAGPAALAPGATSGEAVDRVTLSPEAATPATEAEPTDVASLPAAAPAPSVPPPSRAERRAEALFAALDADEDGSITEDEFTEGALKLLRDAGSRRRIDEDGDGDGERRETRGLRRLERKLERTFDRVDKDDDGAISKDELTSALARSEGRHRGRHHESAPAPADPPTAGTTTGATVVSFSVTFVSIAVQRYASVQQAADASKTSDAAAQTPGASAATSAGGTTAIAA